MLPQLWFFRNCIINLFLKLRKFPTPGFCHSPRKSGFLKNNQKMLNLHKFQKSLNLLQKTYVLTLRHFTQKSNIMMTSMKYAFRIHNQKILTLDLFVRRKSFKFTTQWERNENSRTPKIQQVSTHNIYDMAKIFQLYY